MVAKKKRSLSSRDSLGMDKFVKNSAGPGGFDSRFTLGELNNAGSHKQHTKYF